MKHREALPQKFVLGLHGDGKIMENTQVLEESESTAYPFLSLDKML